MDSLIILHILFFNGAKTKKKTTTTCPAVYSTTSVLGAAPSKLPPDSRLGEENKGHQLLMKMGKFLMLHFFSKLNK